MILFWLFGFVAWIFFLAFFPLIFLRKETLRTQEELYDKYDIHPMKKADMSKKNRIIVNAVFLTILLALFISDLNKQLFRIF